MVHGMDSHYLSPLQKLPTELRNEVFLYTFYGHSASLVSRLAHHSTVANAPQAGITRTCRQFRRECLLLYYATVQFVADLNLSTPFPHATMLDFGLRRLPSAQRTLIGTIKVNIRIDQCITTWALASIVRLYRDRIISSTTSFQVVYLQDMESSGLQDRLQFYEESNETQFVANLLSLCKLVAERGSLIGGRNLQEIVYEDLIRLSNNDVSLRYTMRMAEARFRYWDCPVDIIEARLQYSGTQSLPQNLPLRPSNYRDGVLSPIYPLLAPLPSVDEADLSARRRRVVRFRTYLSL